MGHMLEQDARTGEYSFVSRLVPAWHRLGKIFTRDIPFQEAIEEANLIYPVVKTPIVAKVPCSFDAEGNATDTVEVPSGDGFAIVRTDKMHVLGHVGSTYSILNNRDAFAPVDRLVSNGIARIETAGVLREGKQAWMLVHVDPEELVKRAFDLDEVNATADQLEQFSAEVAPYLFFSNDFTGKASAWVRETWIRVVCANTWASAESSDAGSRVQVAHAGAVEDNYANATNLLLNSLASRFGGASVSRDRLMNHHLSNAEFKALVLDPVAPIAHLEAKIREGGPDATKWTETALEKKLAMRSRIADLWTDGEGHTGEPTAWFAFQGLVQYMDHEATTSNRAVAMYEGDIQRKKSVVLSNLNATVMSL